MDSIAATFAVFLTSVGSATLAFMVARLQSRVRVLEERERFHLAAIGALSLPNNAPAADLAIGAGYATGSLIAAQVREAVGLPIRPAIRLTPSKAPGRAQPRRSRKPVEPLDRAGVKALLDCCDVSGGRRSLENRRRLRALILLLSETGLPLSEAVQLTAARLHDECYLGEGAWPAVSISAAAALAECGISASGHIFGEAEGDCARGDCARVWRRRLNDLGKRAGISGAADRLTRPHCVDSRDEGTQNVSVTAAASSSAAWTSGTINDIVATLSNSVGSAVSNFARGVTAEPG